MADELFAMLSVPRMVEAGAFGPGLRFSSFEPDRLHGDHNQFASTVLYGTLTVTGKDGGDAIRHRLVFKLKHRVFQLRAFFKNHKQFGNEILFYERIMPSLSRRAPPTSLPPYAVYFCGYNDGDDADECALSDVIVLENVTPRGFGATDQPLFMDFDHVIVALEWIAKFHGLSYRAKHEDSKNFAETIADISETQWRENSEWVISFDGLKDLIEVALKKIEERQDSDSDDVRIDRFRSEFLDDPKRTLNRVMTPREPMAVLCHGDFNRNNMLFRYENLEAATGHRSCGPIDALAFDMATIRYGSPALDLSFFLFMNTDRQLRDDRWDDLLDFYCSKVAESVSDVAGLKAPSRAQLDDEIRENAFYGLAHISFFLRVMTEEHKSLDSLQFVELSDEDSIKVLLSYGGDRATNLIADVLEKILDLVYAEQPRYL